MTCLNDYLAVNLDGAKVFHGSNLDVLPLMADNSVDSIVCDPPYELGFMGKSWDSSGIAYSVELWRECLRVLKPGGHLLAFGGSRTWHRVAVAIEDAGFEMRDSIAWLYGSGFPKSHNVALGIDKLNGAENRGRAIPTASSYQASDVNEENKLTSNPVEAYEAKSDESAKWQGWGTALKPAVEPIIVARKPLEGTVAQNVLKYGTGGLNIDASRIGSEERVNGGMSSLGVMHDDNWIPKDVSSTVTGRWPANLILDETTAEMLDEQADASRFFYIAKANKRDRNEGLDGLPAKGKVFNGHNPESAGLAKGSVEDKFTTQPAQNFHPTVKPTTLMEYLIKLVTPEGGTVLDPFTGSGSTGKAALLNGFEFIGIELTPDYLPIIEGRLTWAIEQKGKELL
jgi:site-specific DNA-methyltransferase (adenine-specific)